MFAQSAPYTFCMRRKRWLRGPAASVPKVAVRNELPWRVKVLLLLVGASVLSLIVAAALFIYSYNRLPDADDARALLAEIDVMRTSVKQALDERDQKAALAVRFENQLRIDTAAHEQVRAQLKLLENENARLREDLSFFESLLPTPADAKGVVIRSFRLQPVSEVDGPAREPARHPKASPDRSPDMQALRYRLLVQQSGRPERDFVGAVSLTVSLLRDGRPWVLQLPDATRPDAGPAPLAFRHYQRVEGTFELPEGAIVRSVQVKIQSGGEVRAQQTFTM